MELLQIKSEFAPVEKLYRQLAPSRVLEIGCWDGGTLQVWLEGCAPDATVVAVDPNHRNQQAYQEWRQPDTQLIVVTGLSQDAVTVSEMQKHAPYDWVFIDGDHSDYAVRSDVQVCLPLVRRGGHLLLHDITPPYQLASYPPGVVLDELEEQGYRLERFEEINRDPWAHGIGVVHL